MRRTIERIDVSKHWLIKRLILLSAELDLDRDDFVVFGSAPLLAHGLRRSIRDLDVVARGTAWSKAAESGEPAVGAISETPMAHFCGGRIQFSPQWISTDWDTDELIDRAGIIHGLRFADLADVLVYKRALMRPKDVKDLKALGELTSDAITRSTGRFQQDHVGTHSSPRVSGSTSSTMPRLSPGLRPILAADHVL